MVVTPTFLVILVRCSGRPDDTPDVVCGRGSRDGGFRQSLRCSKCGGGSVMASRAMRNERAVLRRMHCWQGHRRPRFFSTPSDACFRRDFPTRFPTQLLNTGREKTRLDELPTV